MKLNIFFLVLVLFLVSCNSKNGKDIELQQFSEIKVKEFKKKNVALSTTLRFFNPNELSVKVVYVELDILVNDKDVGTFISKNTKEVTGNGLYEIPINVDFKPEDAFLNLDYGLIKIKSDVVANVSFSGFIQTVQNGDEEKIKISIDQKVLFSNNGKLFLDENGNIQNL